MVNSNQQIVKTDLQENPLVKSLTVAIQNNGNLDVTRVDKMAVNLELKKFKNQNGSVNFPAVFDIPRDQRIPALAKKDMAGTIKIITVALTLALETMNLKRQMTPFQILDLAETILDTSDEGDTIALEDLMLFLQKLTRGEYAELYEGFDQVKFMARFSKYRDERWAEGIRIREEKHLEYKALGDPQRQGRKLNDFEQHLHEYTTKLQAKKDEIRELKEELKRKR